MNRIGHLMTDIGLILFFFATGIIAISTDSGGEYGIFSRFLFGESDFSNIFIIFISVSAFVAGIILLLSLFKIEFTITDSMLLFYALGWVSFIIVMDIIYPILNKINPLDYFRNLAIHLFIQGKLFISIRRFKKCLKQ